MRYKEVIPVILYAINLKVWCTLNSFKSTSISDLLEISLEGSIYAFGYTYVIDYDRIVDKRLRI
jgi:hypothetical protein